MNRKFLLAFLLSISFIAYTSAQIGIKAGVNMANEITSFNSGAIANSFQSRNLTGYQIGLVYQKMPKVMGFGFETGVMLSQKGNSFTYSDEISVGENIKKGYKELNYVEIPFNVRYHISLGFIGFYASAGVYGGYTLSGKKVDDSNQGTEKIKYPDFDSRTDYGYNLGVGLEVLNKIQLGTNWSQGLKNTTNSNTSEDIKSSKNRVYSVTLVYLF